MEARFLTVRSYEYEKEKDGNEVCGTGLKFKVSLWTQGFCVFFKIYFIDYAITVVPFPPLTPLCPAHPVPPTFPPISTCPLVVHVSSLAATFPILFLTSSCLFSTYHLCYLFSVLFLPLAPSHSPIDNPPCDLHFCGSVPVLVVCLVCLVF